MADTQTIDPRSVLDPIPIDRAVKAAAWDAYTHSTTPQDFQSKMSGVGIPDSAKADLWDLKFNGGVSSERKVAPAVVPATTPLAAIAPGVGAAAALPTSPNFSSSTISAPPNAPVPQVAAAPPGFQTAGLPTNTSGVLQSSPSPSVAPIGTGSTLSEMATNAPGPQYSAPATLRQGERSPQSHASLQTPGLPVALQPGPGDPFAPAEAHPLTVGVPAFLGGLDPSGITPGIAHVVTGGYQALRPGATGPERATGVREAIGGGLDALTPALVGAPLADTSGVVSGIAKTGLALATGIFAQKGIDAGLQHLGIAPEYAGLGGDIAGLVAGWATGRLRFGPEQQTLMETLQDKGPGTPEGNAKRIDDLRRMVDDPNGNPNEQQLAQDLLLKKFGIQHGPDFAARAAAQTSNPVPEQAPAQEATPKPPVQSPALSWLATRDQSIVTPITTTGGIAYVQPAANGIETITDPDGEALASGPPAVVAAWMDAHAVRGGQQPTPATVQPTATQPAKPKEAFNSPEFLKAHNVWNTARIKAISKYMSENSGADEATATQATAGTYGREPQIADYQAPSAPPSPQAPEPEPPSQVQHVGPMTPNPPTAAIPTLPESPETIAIQLQQLSAGQRKVVMFPQGQGQPLTFPPGVQLHHDSFGNTYAYDPQLIKKSEIAKAAQNNTLPEILGHSELGMGAPDKSALQGEPVVVSAHAPDGTEVQSTATDLPSLPQTLAAAQAVKPEGGTVRVGTPADVLAGRDGAPDQDLYKQAVDLVRSRGEATPSMLQQHLRVGYGVATRLLDQMLNDGVIGPSDGRGRSDVLPLTVPPATTPSAAPVLAPSLRNLTAAARALGLDPDKLFDIRTLNGRRALRDAVTQARQPAQQTPYPPPPVPGVTQRTELEPWFLGNTEGQQVTPERIAEMNDHIRNRPDEPYAGRGALSVGEGEAFNQFKDPLINYVQEQIARYKPGDRILNVTHYRDIQAVKSWLAKGAPADRSVNLDEMTRKGDQEPGGLYRLDERAIQAIQNGLAPAPSDFHPVETADQDGIYFGRHGATAWNDKSGPNAGEQPGTESTEVFRGSSNIDLAPDGVRDAHDLAARTAGQFTEINSSPLKRAHDTAAIVAAKNPQVLEPGMVPATPAALAIPSPPESLPIDVVQHDAFPPTLAAAPTTEPGHIRLANAAFRILQNGGGFGNNVKFQELADAAYGGSRAAGTYTMKQAYDALEAAINRYVSDSIGANLLSDDPHYALGKLRELMNRLPTQNVRSQEQELLQQYSTPPTLAYLVARVAAILPTDVVLEPSAGTGSLLSWAKAAGAIVHGNEIDPQRAELLNYAVRGSAPTGVDAEYLHATLPPEIQPTVVIMNPPFSSTGGRLSQNRNSFGYAHVIQALARLPVGGRLVAILGEGARPEAATAQPFWKALQHFTLAANVGIGRGEYTKYGTSFGNRVIVVDKVPSAGRPALTGDYNSVEEAYDALQPIIGTRSTPFRRSNSAGVVQPGGELLGPTGSESGVPGELGAGTRIAAAGQTINPVLESGPSASPSDVSGQEPGTQPAEPAAETGGGNARDSGESAVEPLRPEDRVALESRKKEDLLERVEDDSSFVQYVSSIEGLAHPAQLVETKVMASVNPPPVTYAPNLPKNEEIERALTPEQRENFKPLSAAQMETVARAGQMHQQFNEDGQRLGFLLGDGTGVGKGQQIAAIIWDRNRSGQKRAVWVSASKGLQTDAARDFNGAGATGLADKLFSINDWKASESINVPEGVIFSTYQSLIAKAQGEKGKTRLEQLKEWLGPEGVIIFDEAQKGKNAVAGEGSRAVSSKTGEAVVKLQDDLPKAYVVYASATAATDVNNLGYMTRMGLWGKGTPFHQGFSHFMAEVGQGGIAAMELIAREMKSAGKYVSRSISYRGVSYEEKIHDLIPDQRTTYDSAARGWQKVLTMAEEQIRENGGGAREKGDFLQRYWGEHQRFFRKLLTAMKVPTVLDIADQALADGKSVIISLIGTGQAATDKAIAAGALESDDDLDFSPKDSLIQLIRDSYPTIMYEEYEDENGTVKTRPVIRDGKVVHNPEAVQRRDDLITELNESLALPESPLDSIVRHYGRNMVAELTGRKKTIERNPVSGKWESVSRAPEGVPLDKINGYEMNQFQNGGKRVAVISKASSAGFSLHSDKKAKNQQPRVHIVAELSWSADDQMQTFGRSHRSNQIQPPEYWIVSTNAGGEKRFSSTIARRLESLGALTKGQRDASGGGSVLAKYNFETEQGIQATQAFYKYLADEDPTLEGSQYTGHEILKQMGILKQKLNQRTGEPEGEPYVDRQDQTNVTRLMNRVLNIELGTEPYNNQNAVFGLFTNLFDQMVQRAIEAGTLDTGVDLVRGDNIRLKRATAIAKDPQSGASTYRYVLEVGKKTKPIPASVVEDLHEKGRGRMMKAREFKGVTEPDQLIWVQRSQAPVTTRSGAVEKGYLVFGPEDMGDKRYRTLSESDLMQYWEPIEGSGSRARVKDLDKSIKDAEKMLDEQKALKAQGRYSSEDYYQRHLDELKAERNGLVAKIREAAEKQFDWWQEAHDAAPRSKVDRVDMIGGSVMRVWPLLKVGNGRMDIKIAYPDSGGSITGVAMTEGDANEVEQSLTGQRVERGPGSVFQSALTGKESFELEGRITLSQGRVNKKPVIEISTNDRNNQRFFDQIGVQREKIGWQYKYYIPNDPAIGVPILEQLLKQFPVQESTKRGGLARPRAMSPDGNGKFLAGADAQYVAQADEPGHVYVNKSAMRIIAKASRWLDDLHGITLAPADLPKVHQAFQREMQFEANPVLRAAIKRVQDAIDRASLHNYQLKRKDVVTIIDGTDSEEDTARTEREEIVHRHQIELGLAGTGGYTDEAIADLPMVSEALQALRAARPVGYSQQDALAELGAVLLSGQADEIHYGEHEATETLKEFIEGLIASHGPEAGKLLRGATPEVRKALGNDYVKARWNGDTGRVRRDAGPNGSAGEGERPLARPNRDSGLPELPGPAHADQGANEGTNRPSSVTLSSGFGALQPELEKLYERDIKPNAKALTRNLSGAFDALKKVFAPGLRGPQAYRTEGLVRERGAEIDQRRDRAYALLNALKPHFLKMAAQQGFHGLDVWDAIETGRTMGLTGADLAFARTARTLLDARLQELQHLGILKNYVENYLPREWKNEEDGARWIQNWQTKRPMAGSEAFRRRRTYPTLRDGLDDPDFTLVPKFDNPVDMLLSKLGQMDQSITAHRAFEELDRKGDITYVPAGKKPPLGTQPIDDKMFTVYGPRQGAVSIDSFKQDPTPKRSDFGHGPGRWHLTPDERARYDTAMRDWRDMNVLPEDVTVHGQRIMGRYYAPEPVARVINNHLSTMGEMSPLTETIQGVNNFMNAVQLSLSWYHGLTTALNSSFSDMALGIEQMLPKALGGSGKPLRGLGSIGRGIAPFASFVHDVYKGTTIQAAWDMPAEEFDKLKQTDPGTWAIVDALKAGGGKARQDAFYQKQFAQAVVDEWQKGNHVGAVARVIPAIAETLMKPIMEIAVPRVKLAAFGKLMAEEMQRHPAYSRDELRAQAGQIWNSMDNRFGQLAQRNLIMHALARGTVNAIVGRPGWNLGSVQELGGGAKDALRNVADLLRGRTTTVSHKTAYLLALLIGGIAINGLLSWYLSGELPTGMDFIAPRDGGSTEDGRPSRIILPTYLSKDLYSYGTRPAQTLIAKASPLLSVTADLFRNRDFFDRKIYGDRGIGMLQYLRNELYPYSLTGLEKNRERHAALGSQARPFFGIMPAGKRVGLSDAENMITDYQDEQEANTRAPSTQRNKAKQEVFMAARTSPQRAYAVGNQYVAQHQLKPADVTHAIERARQIPLVADYKHVSDFPTAMRIYNVASDEEKKQIRGEALRKANQAAADPTAWKLPDGTTPDTGTINLAWKYFHIGPGPQQAHQLQIQ